MREVADAFDVAFYAPLVEPLLRGGLDGIVPGGSELQTLLVARALAARGHRVAIVTVAHGEHPPPELFDGVRVIAHPPWHPRRIVAPGLAAAAQLAELHGALRAVPARVWVQRAAGATTGQVALSACLSRRRFVYSAASVLDFDHHRIVPGAISRAMFALGVRLAARVVVQTGEQAELCRQRFRREPVVAPSIALPAAPRHRRGSAFLWIGRLAALKRPQELLELARVVPEARFVVVGGPDIVDDGATARATEQAAGGLANVEFAGHVPRARVLEMLDDAVAVVNTTEAEGMPNVFLDGWARGVPALSLFHDPDGVIERERLGSFAGGDRRRLAVAARALWAAKDDAAALAQRCQSYVRRAHSEDAAARAWEHALGLGRPA